MYYSSVERTAFLLVVILAKRDYCVCRLCYVFSGVREYGMDIPSIAVHFTIRRALPTSKLNCELRNG